MKSDYFSRLQAPTTLAGLCEALKISGPYVLCACNDNTNKRCQHKVVKDAVQNIRFKLMELTTFTEASPYLEQLSRKLLCSAQHHQRESTTLFRSWKSKLGSVHAQQDSEEATTSDGESDEQDEYRVRRFLFRSLPQYYDNNYDYIPTSIPTSPPASPRGKFKKRTSSGASKDTNETVRERAFKTLTNQELAEQNVQGFIYIFTYAPDGSGPQPGYFYKVGSSKCAAKRVAQWERQCGKKLRRELIYPTKLYKRVESLVHAHHVTNMISEDCDVCNTTHVEWVDMRVPELARSVSLWSNWIAQEPYDDQGVLKPEWKQRLKALDTNKANCWETFVYQEANSNNDTGVLHEENNTATQRMTGLMEAVPRGQTAATIVVSLPPSLHVLAWAVVVLLILTLFTKQ